MDNKPEELASLELTLPTAEDGVNNLVSETSSESVEHSDVKQNQGGTANGTIQINTHLDTQEKQSVEDAQKKGLSAQEAASLASLYLHESGRKGYHVVDGNSVVVIPEQAFSCEALWPMGIDKAILIGDAVLPVNSRQLSGRNGYFRALFAGCFFEASSSLVVLQPLPLSGYNLENNTLTFAELFASLLSYLHTGENFKLPDLKVANEEFFVNVVNTLDYIQEEGAALRAHLVETCALKWKTLAEKNLFSPVTIPVWLFRGVVAKLQWECASKACGFWCKDIQIGDCALVQEFRDAVFQLQHEVKVAEIWMDEHPYALNLMPASWLLPLLKHSLCSRCNKQIRKADADDITCPYTQSSYYLTRADPPPVCFQAHLCT